MRTPTINRYVCCLVCILLITTVSCLSPVPPSSTPISTLTTPTTCPQPTITASALSLELPTNTAVPTPSPTVPTRTPTPSPEPPTRTPRPTATVTATPAPTLSLNEEEALVLELLKHNGGCQLPCWWGFTPGKTSSQVVENFFLSHGKKLWRVSDLPGYVIIFDMPSHHHYQDYSVKDGIVEMIEIAAIPPHDANEGEPNYGDLQFSKAWASYVLPQILTTYGPPAQILLGVARGTPWVPFDLMLFYPDLSMMVQYSGPAERGEATFRVCPHKTEITILLWSAEHSRTLEDMPSVGNYTSDLYSLEQAVGMSDAQFYQTFSSPDDLVCLETPKNIW